MLEPEKVLSRIFNRWINRWGIIFSFREVAEAGLPYATRVISDTRARWARELVTDPEWDKVFWDKMRFTDMGGPEVMAGLMTKLAVENARQSVDAASIVFAHSILDDMALDCCRIITSVDPEADSYIENRKASFEEWRDRGQDILRKELFAGLVSELQKDSLLRKVDFVFQFCRPASGWTASKDYRYDRDRLVRLDKLRQDIVHGDALATSVPNINDDLHYMNRTGMHLILLINHRYSIKMDPDVAIGISRTPPAKE
jgi:hypothetical protein